MSDNNSTANFCAAISHVLLLYRQRRTDVQVLCCDWEEQSEVVDHGRGELLVVASQVSTVAEASQTHAISASSHSHEVTGFGAAEALVTHNF